MQGLFFKVIAGTCIYLVLEIKIDWVRLTFIFMDLYVLSNITYGKFQYQFNVCASTPGCLESEITETSCIFKCIFISQMSIWFTIVLNISIPTGLQSKQ